MGEPWWSRSRRVAEGVVWLTSRTRNAEIGRQGRPEPMISKLTRYQYPWGCRSHGTNLTRVANEASATDQVLSDRQSYQTCVDTRQQVVTNYSQTTRQTLAPTNGEGFENVEDTKGNESDDQRRERDRHPEQAENLTYDLIDDYVGRVLTTPTSGHMSGTDNTHGHQQGKETRQADPSIGDVLMYQANGANCDERCDGAGNERCVSQA